MKTIKSISDKFQARNFGIVKLNYKISNLSYWKIGGECAAVFYPNSLNAISFLITNLTNSNINYSLVGKTSNLLFTDERMDGALIVLGDSFNYVKQYDEKFFTIGASASVPWTCYKLGSRGFGGIEHCVGIPGSFGGLVFMNGGSLRECIGDNIHKVKVLDIEKDSEVVLEKKDCEFSYRDSIFQNNNYVILEVVLKLHKADSSKIKEKMLDILRARRAKFPLNYPSCGSVFKSTKDSYEKFGPPGKIIENLELKGMRAGGAKISEKHANFIINYEKASCDDVISLIKIIQERLRANKYPDLPTEVNYVGKDLKILPLSQYVSSNV